MHKGEGSTKYQLSTTLTKQWDHWRSQFTWMFSQAVLNPEDVGSMILRISSIHHSTRYNIPQYFKLKQHSYVNIISNNWINVQTT